MVYFWVAGRLQRLSEKRLGYTIQFSIGGLQLLIQYKRSSSYTGEYFYATESF